MEVIILIAAFIYFVLVVIAVVTVIGIPEHLIKMRAEIARNSKILEGLGSSLDAIRTELVDTRNVVSQVKDIQSSKLERIDKMDRRERLEKVEKVEKAVADTVVLSKPVPTKPPDLPQPSAAPKSSTHQEEVQVPETKQEQALQKPQSVWRYRPQKVQPQEPSSD